MKIVVTGATGFIGSRLSLTLNENGYDIVALGQTNNELEDGRFAELASAGIETVRASLFDEEEIRSALEGCERVIHLAAAQHEANVPDSHFQQVNVDGVRKLLELCLSAGVKRFVHGSTIGVYGEATELALDENSPTNPQNIYGVTKLEGEKLALSYSDRIFVSAVRISETYGPGDGRLLKLFRAIKNGSFTMIGSGNNRRQLIHVDDLTEALWLAGEKDEARGQLFVVAGSEVLTTSETVKVISNALDKKARSWHLPMWPFLWLAWGLEQTLGRVGIQPPLHRRRLDFFRKSFVFRCDKATDILGFAPKISFVDGAEETARWYQSRGLL
jgi:nucleoside-diphosphate-sugar epimerase